MHSSRIEQSVICCFAGRLSPNPFSSSFYLVLTSISSPVHLTKFRYSLCPRLEVVVRLPVVDHALQVADAQAKSATIVSRLPEVAVAGHRPAPPVDLTNLCRHLPESAVACHRPALIVDLNSLFRHRPETTVVCHHTAPLVDLINLRRHPTIPQMPPLTAEEGICRH